MSSIFDDLFDKFFNRKQKKTEEPKEEESKISEDFVKKLMDSINAMGDFDKNFGTPTKVEYYEEDGVYFKREIWNVNGGEMIHVVGSMEPFTDDVTNLPIDKQLEIALENENYEEAAILRDKIKLINK